MPHMVVTTPEFLSPLVLTSVDNGRGYVAVLRSAGITHVSHANNVANLTLSMLKDWLGELSQRGLLVVLNFNVNGSGRHTMEVDVVSSNIGRVEVRLMGLTGLLSYEREMFRGLPMRT
ncbi:hypothetical protein HJC23_007276 [Cyclotella cryptica]|uniref:Uncharacterized protein n=1 Tax=Cyclotella cryptica TaxID=29204 RepID=A0ABD3Q230_9STRA